MHENPHMRKSQSSGRSILVGNAIVVMADMSAYTLHPLYAATVVVAVGAQVQARPARLRAAKAGRHGAPQMATALCI
jgi:hypothetical protein